MARIFLSHASSDKPVVRRLRDALNSAGHQSWLDEDEILVGESIPDAVTRGLRNTDFVVVCISKAGVSSGWVKNELELTVMRQFGERVARVLPVRLDDVAPPDSIKHLLYVNIFPDQTSFTQGVNKLLRSITGHEVARTNP